MCILCEKYYKEYWDNIDYIEKQFKELTSWYYKTFYYKLLYTNTNYDEDEKEKELIDRVRFQFLDMERREWDEKIVEVAHRFKINLEV